MTAATFRYPGPLAISVANVDQMSGGRIEFGLGAGWYEAEHDAYGIPFPGVGERFDRLEEQLHIVTGLWATPVGETFSFVGKHYRLKDSPASPKPHAGKPPILIGGTGARRTPRLAARFADEFNVAFRTASETAAVFDRVRAACVAQGREVDPIYSVAQVLCCGRDEGEVARRAAAIGRQVDELRQHGLAGSPAEIVDKIASFGHLGCSRVYLQVLDLHDLEHLELVASEVAPQL
jgi:alkanesulfonate monooxygenase SsuD/methylene tetrahydromethanopterin reductase-like flavin-dependent oxidoreductase (luciferase family)